MSRQGRPVSLCEGIPASDLRKAAEIRVGRQDFVDSVFEGDCHKMSVVDEISVYRRLPKNPPHDVGVIASF